MNTPKIDYYSDRYKKELAEDFYGRLRDFHKHQLCDGGFAVEMDNEGNKYVLRNGMIPDPTILVEEYLTYLTVITERIRENRDEFPDMRIH